MAQQDIIVLDEVQAQSSEHIAGEKGSVIDNADGSKTYYLKYPLKYQEKKGEPIITLDRINIRRPNAGDMKMAEKEMNDMTRAEMLFNRLTGLKDGLFDQFDLADMAKFTEITEDFLPTPPKNGKKS